MSAPLGSEIDALRRQLTEAESLAKKWHLQYKNCDEMLRESCARAERAEAELATFLQQGPVAWISEDSLLWLQKKRKKPKRPEGLK